MRFVMLTQSLRSCWNHGNAHFLRGVATELMARGHDVHAFEPRHSWSVGNLTAEHGAHAVHWYREAYPGLATSTYAEPQSLDPVLDDADVVLVHEWNDPAVVAHVGAHRARRGRYALLFHDTHHRSVTAPHEMARYDLSAYDAVLAFGQTIARVYEREAWAEHVFVWHEAADPAVFYPRESVGETGDLVWVGNWAGDERAAELREFLLNPVADLELRATICGVRYPPEALDELADAGVAFGGWVPNHRVPELFAHFSATVHVPRRPYVEALPGIPTIRVFEALACGMPLVSAPWDDSEGLFSPGLDYLVATDGEAMRDHLAEVCSSPSLRRALRMQGLATIRARHTCGHRVDELLRIVTRLGPRHDRSVRGVDLTSSREHATHEVTT